MTFEEVKEKYGDKLFHLVSVDRNETLFVTPHGNNNLRIYYRTDEFIYPVPTIFNNTISKMADNRMTKHGVVPIRIAFNNRILYQRENAK